MSILYCFASDSNPRLHGFAADEGGGALPPEQGPWRLLQRVDPQEGWTKAAEISTVEAGIRTNGFALVESAAPLTFGDSPVRPGA